MALTTVILIATVPDKCFYLHLTETKKPSRLWDVKISLPKVAEPVNGRDGIELSFVCLTPPLIFSPLHYAALHKTAGVDPGADGMGAQECKNDHFKGSKTAISSLMLKRQQEGIPVTSLKKLS